jgi:hypothetical protein
MQGMRGAVAVVLLAAGCGSDGGEDTTQRSAQVYEAIIAGVVVDDARPADGSTPVIYAVADGTEPIPLAVQAHVADAMKEDADVRFADSRADVIDESDAREPVDDDAVLVLLGPVPERGRRVQVPVQIYRAQTDQSSLVVTLMQSGDRWTVRSTDPS